MKTPCFHSKKTGRMKCRVASNVLTRNIERAKASRQVPDFHFGFLDFGFWIVLSPAFRRLLSNPKSKIQNPKCVHGDAIVRDLHPPSLSLEAILIFKDELIITACGCEVNRYEIDQTDSCDLCSFYFSVFRYSSGVAIIIGR